VSLTPRQHTFEVLLRLSHNSLFSATFTVASACVSMSESTVAAATLLALHGASKASPRLPLPTLPRHVFCVVTTVSSTTQPQRSRATTTTTQQRNKQQTAMEQATTQQTSDEPQTTTTNKQPNEQQQQHTHHSSRYKRVVTHSSTPNSVHYHFPSSRRFSIFDFSSNFPANYGIALWIDCCEARCQSS